MTVIFSFLILCWDIQRIESPEVVSIFWWCWEFSINANFCRRCIERDEEYLLRLCTNGLIDTSISFITFTQLNALRGPERRDLITNQPFSKSKSSECLSCAAQGKIRLYIALKPTSRRWFRIFIKANLTLNQHLWQTEGFRPNCYGLSHKRQDLYVQSLGGGSNGTDLCRTLLRNAPRSLWRLVGNQRRNVGPCRTMFYQKQSRLSLIDFLKIFTATRFFVNTKSRMACTHWSSHWISNLCFFG